MIVSFRNIARLIVLFPLFFSACSTSESGRSAKEESTDLTVFADEIFQEAVDSAEIAGAAILIYQNGQKLLDAAYGFASLEWSVPLTKDASFEIGSVTKQFTAAAILRLVEAGQLSLEDDFTKYIDFDTHGRKITIQQLLNHTSGIPSYTEISEFWPLSLHEEARDSLVRLVEKNDFLFEPGEALIYNNSGYYLLGLIIEKVTDMSYEDYLAEQFFLPLKMNNTYYCSSSKVVKKKAYGYDFSPEGLRQKGYLDHTWPYAAGSLCSTTGDLLTWLTALHNGKVLNENLYESIITPDTLNDGSPVRYAKGLMHYDDNGHELISHGGGINGFLSDTRYYPEEDLYIICLVNTTGPKGGSYFADELTLKILDKKEPETQPVDMDLEALAGIYSGQARGRVLDVELKPLDESIIIDIVGRNDPDTLKAYLGQQTWVDGKDIFYFNGNALSIDQVSGYYVLTKKD